MILIFNQTKHVGGGQNSVNGQKYMLDILNIKYEYIEELINLKILKKIILRQYEFIIVHYYSPLCIIYSIILLMIRIKSIVTVHGLWFLEVGYQNQKLSFFKRRMLIIIQGLIFFCCHKLLVFSEYERNLVIKHYRYVKDKIILVPGGVDNRKFYRIDDHRKREIRKRLNFDQDTPIFLVVARMERRKGIEITIEAINDLKMRDCQLIIVFPTGIYSYFETLQECFKKVAFLETGNKVRFITGVRSEDVSLYYQASDYFLMSSLDLETFGYTTLEASACGCIPVGFYSGATPELISKIDKELIIDEISSIALSQKMHWLLLQSNLKIISLRKKCIEFSINYQWDKIAELYFSKIL